jgi:hypothetical protein
MIGIKVTISAKQFAFESNLKAEHRSKSIPMATYPIEPHFLLQYPARPPERLPRSEATLGKNTT